MCKKCTFLCLCCRKKYNNYPTCQMCYTTYMNKMLRYIFSGVILIAVGIGFWVSSLSEQNVSSDVISRRADVSVVDAAPRVVDNGVSDPISEPAYVLYTLDGDTIAVLVGSSTIPERLRLIGVDTPETFEGSGQSGRDTCYGEEAKKYTRELLTKKSVTLVADTSQDNKDKYGRLLRYVFLDGVNVGEMLVLGGYAREYTFKGVAYMYQKEFREAEQEAKVGKKGLWAVCE